MAGKLKLVHPLMLDHHRWNREKCMVWILERIASSSDSLYQILDDGGERFGKFPRYAAVMEWLSDDPSLAERYARSKKEQADLLVDEILQIADRETSSWTDENGYRKFDGADVQSKRLQVDARKWVAAKLKPSKYGDSLTVDGELGVRKLDDEQLESRIAKLAGKATVVGIAGGKGSS